ncbi:hypothetical protein ACFQ1T_02595, partial [Methylophilus glucosoxydans]
SVILIFKEQCLEGFSLFRFNFQRFKRSAHYTEVFYFVNNFYSAANLTLKHTALFYFFSPN